MAENIDEEPLDNSSNIQSEKPSEEIIPTKDADTINPNQETDNMEVHHHAHHEGKKNWKSYFWEFLMLFLAVFCGFLAENQREHIVENKREKQFMQSLVRDLKKDTIFLNSSFPKKAARIKAIDSVFTFFENNPQPNEIPGYVIVQMRRTTWDQLIDRNNSTIDQMKNSGNLRLIRKQNIADSLAEYDLLWQRAALWREMYLHRQDENFSYQQKIVSGSALLRFHSKDTASDLREVPSIKIHSAYLDEYYNYLNRQRGTTRNDTRIYKIIYDYAIMLIDLINKEYHLE